MINSDNESRVNVEDIPIKYFKMINGDSVISYVHTTQKKDGPILVLQEPMVVIMDDEYNFRFSPWFPFSKKNVHFIDLYNVLCEDEVEDHIKRSYIALLYDDMGIDNMDDVDIGTMH
jgi:hypothetical protein